MKFPLSILAAWLLAMFSAQAWAAPPKPPADESVLGEFVVTGTIEERLPRIAVLPSLSPAMEDVIVRSVVRRDLELTGMFDVISDDKAPDGLYGFGDPVDVAAWRALGAEAIVKVSARKHSSGKIEVLGLAYFVNHGNDPVFEKKLLVDEKHVRVTAHRITDALIGALTGSPGGFASHFTFAAPWGRNRRVFTMDSDGHDLKPVTKEEHTAIAPTWGPDGSLFVPISENYSPYRLYKLEGNKRKRVDLPFENSIYSVAFNKDHSKMALAVAEDGGGSSIYVINPDGSGAKKVSKTELATHPVFSPSGKLAWIGGDADGVRRVYLDGKPISPAGFTAAAPEFCDTDEGIRLVYAVQVRGDRQDLVMSNERGQGVSRLTQNQGSNAYPACSPDGRMLAFFSTREKGNPGMYLMSLKRWTTQRLANQHGVSLRWDALPPVPEDRDPQAAHGASEPAAAADSAAPPEAAFPQEPSSELLPSLDQWLQWIPARRIELVAARAPVAP